MGAHLYIDAEGRPRMGLPTTPEFIAAVERGEYPMIGVPRLRLCACGEKTRNAICEHCGRRYDA